jgi:hypothetical protein
VTHSGAITLPGWRTHNATVHRVGGKYDVRATHANKVIRLVPQWVVISRELRPEL